MEFVQSAFDDIRDMVEILEFLFLVLQSGLEFIKKYAKRNAVRSKKKIPHDVEHKGNLKL